MLLEHALALHVHNIVPLKGVWIDPNQETYEGRVLEIVRDEEQAAYRVTMEGFWGGNPVTVTQPIDSNHPQAAPVAKPTQAQFGSLIVKVDHFRNDPLEWLAQHDIDIQALNAQAANFVCSSEEVS